MNNDLPIKDKVAVIFHGIVGGMSDRNGVGPPSNISVCSKTIHHNVLSQYDCDIFAHSWSMDQSEEIKKLYNLTDSLFQPQEYFGFTGQRASESPEIGMEFRLISKYINLERAMNLKQQYELKNGFKYKWVLVLRYDLIIFTKLDLSKYDPKCVYICEEPHWKDNMNLFDDRIFLSNSMLMDEFSKFGGELFSKKYNGKDIHTATRNKIFDILKNNQSLIQFGFKRYEDVEVYRQMMHPETNTVGHAYGALECKGRLKELIKEIDNNEK